MAAALVACFWRPELVKCEVKLVQCELVNANVWQNALLAGNPAPHGNMDEVDNFSCHLLQFLALVVKILAHRHAHSEQSNFAKKT